MSFIGQARIKRFAVPTSLKPSVRLQVKVDAETAAKIESFMRAYQIAKVQTAALELIKVGLKWTIEGIQQREIQQ
jgi:hypothetical protein